MPRYSFQPRIVISGADLTPSFQAMVKRVSEAGAEVIMVTKHASHNPVEDFHHADGIAIMGNNFDIDPIHYINRYPENDPRRKVHPSTRSELECEHATARAKYENAIMKLALLNAMPMLCICGGMQRLNVLCGGTLHQHVPDMTGHDKLRQDTIGADGKTPTIPIVIESGTKLAIIAKKVQMNFVKSNEPGMARVIMENSFRHQSIDIVGEGLQVCAMSDTVRRKDGTSTYLIEAIEATPHGPYGNQFLIGTQWHPEFGASGLGRELVKNFVKHATNYRKTV